MNKNLEHHFIVSYRPDRGWAIEVDMTFYGGSAFPEGPPNLKMYMIQESDRSMQM